MDTFSHVPPGFRFHPTDEELVDYYLRKKIASKRIDLDVIRDVDLYKIEPWDLQELCKIGTEEQNEWYFFSHKDKKYPTGTRTNRATKAGFWKATGRDKSIYSKQSLIGMRKTLVFYKGRAPNGLKSDWIMHEYRLETYENATPQEEGWVVCRVFKKRMAAIRTKGEHEALLCWYHDDQLSFMPDGFESPRRIIPPPHHHLHPLPNASSHYHHQYHSSSSFKQELHDQLQQYDVVSPPPHHYDPLFLQLPQLESPKIHHSTTFDQRNCHGITTAAAQEDQQEQINPQSRNNQVLNMGGGSIYDNNNNANNIEELADDQVTTDWRVLDKFVASQLSREDNAPTNSSSSFQVAQHMNMLLNDAEEGQDMAPEYASIGSISLQLPN